MPTQARYETDHMGEGGGGSPSPLAKHLLIPPYQEKSPLPVDSPHQIFIPLLPKLHSPQ